MTAATVTSSIKPWIPFITPAIKDDACEVDHQLLMKRTLVVGLAAIALLSVSLIAATTFPFIATIASFSPLLLITIFADMWLANRAADAKAVDEYLNKDFPTKSATHRIQHETHAAQLLVDKKGNVNKYNDHDEYLIDYFPNFDVFKILVDNGALERDKVAYFKKLVSHEKTQFLEYVLKTKKVTPADIPEDQLVEMWTSINDARAAHLLKDYQFNVNARDKSGYTPLLRALCRPMKGLFRTSINGPALTQILLNCGADRNVTVTIDGHVRTAMDFAGDDAQLKRLLEQGR